MSTTHRGNKDAAPTQAAQPTLGYYQYDSDSDPILTIDDEPVGSESTVRLSATWMAAWLKQFYSAGWYAGRDATVSAVKSQWPTIVQQLSNQAAGVPPRIEHIITSKTEPGPVEMAIVAMPERVARSTVVRDKQGRISEAVNVTEDLL